MAEVTHFYGWRASGLPDEAHVYLQDRDFDWRRLNEGIYVSEWTIPHFDVGSFDTVSGESLRDQPGILTDFLNCGLPGSLMVHVRVCDLLAKVGISTECVQWLPVILHEHGRVANTDYYLANLLDVRAAAHPTRSKFVGPNRQMIKPVLKADLLDDAELFRLQEKPLRVYFSERLRRSLDGAGLTGIHWIQVPAFE